ncbi:MAG: hypothetical protein IBX69_13135 [Anaerolineales bacterium]|nr:hypothetical protein [Anaerolineales bacterium]
MARKKLQLFLSGSRSYIDRIIGSAPLVYFPLNETAGTTANNLGTLDTAANGIYTGVDLADTPAPGGGRAPFFDGTNDYVNIYSTALRDAFDGDEGSKMIWMKVANAGVWTDAKVRAGIRLYADGSNRMHIAKRSQVYETAFYYQTGGAVNLLVHSTSDVNWICYVMTWKVGAGGGVYGYYNGIEFDNLGPIANSFAGSLHASNCCIGSYDVTLSNPWHGWLAHGAVWDRVLTPTEVARLAEV